MDSLTQCIILDIGGTLSKLCFVSESKMKAPHNEKLTIGREDSFIYFNYFKNFQSCASYIEEYLIGPEFGKIIVTGGGAYKYKDELSELASKGEKKLSILQQFQSLLGGMTFFKRQFKYQEFVRTIFERNNMENMEKKNSLAQTISFGELKTPLIITNVGSGVSFLLVNENGSGELEAKRIGGTSLGGGFFLGLANLLTGQNSYPALIKMAQEGNQNNIDFTPKDFPQIEQLSEASVLISLAKLNQQSSKNDITRSLFYMVTFNIAQIALIHSQIHGIDNVLFTGFYCRQNEFVLQCFAEAFQFFSKKTRTNLKRVYSMKHDGYLGVLGALGTKVE